MDSSSKWDQLKEYLKNKDTQLMAEIRANANQEALGQLPRISAQLGLLQNVIAQVERLDHAKDTDVGRQAPAQPKY